MSEPFKDYGETIQDKLQGAVNELISARSALNMEPMPMEPPEEIKEAGYPSDSFLSNTDFWVNHSMKHIAEAITLIIQAIKKV